MAFGLKRIVAVLCPAATAMPNLQRRERRADWWPGRAQAGFRMIRSARSESPRSAIRIAFRRRSSSTTKVLLLHFSSLTTRGGRPSVSASPTKSASAVTMANPFAAAYLTDAFVRGRSLKTSLVNVSGVGNSPANLSISFGERLASKSSFNAIDVPWRIAQRRRRPPGSRLFLSKGNPQESPPPSSPTQACPAHPTVTLNPRMHGCPERWPGVIAMRVRSAVITTFTWHLL